MRAKNTLCKHYTTKRHECCAVGVEYESVAIDHDGIDNGRRVVSRSYPCDSRTNLGGATCASRQLPTDEEFATETAGKEAARQQVRADRGWSRLARGYGLAAESIFSTRFPPKDFTFSGMGARGTTPIHTRLNGDGSWDARCGVSVFGWAAATTTWESDPFAEDFRDNVLAGHGATEDEAIAALKAEGAGMVEGLFA